MKAHVEIEWEHRRVAVTFFDEQGSDVFVASLVGDAGRFQWSALPFGERAEPTLYLPLDAAEALFDEARGVLPDSSAIERHLKDALAVRDRLLTLFEKGSA